jgi:hypothetical protein
MAMVHQAHVVTKARIEEHKIDGKPLGRHIEHDSRSLNYRHQRSGAVPVTVSHERMVAIFNQGNVGSCTGNAETGALGTAPLFASLAAAGLKVTLDEAEALKLYSAAEVIDGDGPYPPQDNGSSGLSVCKAAKNAGMIAGYTHLLGLDDVVDALQSTPVIVGVNWYDSFDTPAPDGTVAISAGASVRGGHEFLIRGVDVVAKMFAADNSWGTGWGVKGSFQFSFDTLSRLLSEQGDGTVSIPLTSPAPAPTPGPATVDDTFAVVLDPWAYQHHTGENEVVATAAQKWRAAKGYKR